MHRREARTHDYHYYLRLAALLLFPLPPRAHPSHTCAGPVMFTGWLRSTSLYMSMRMHGGGVPLRISCRSPTVAEDRVNRMQSVSA